jgi:hypothetical protein
MRRCTLRGHENILKRLLIHVGAFNISLVLRTMLGAGKPRELKNHMARLYLRLFAWFTRFCRPTGAVEFREARLTRYRAPTASENFNTASSGFLLL